MSEHIITGANDVDIILERDAGETAGTSSSSSIGRIVVDEFSLTTEEDDALESGIGSQTPDGIVNGDVTHNWSFTMMGQNVDLFNMIASSDGTANVFSFTARKTDDDGNAEWEYGLATCKRTSEEVTASSGDAMEYAVEGIGFGLSKYSDTNEAWNAPPDDG
jgi:hypothetical protein